MGEQVGRGQRISHKNITLDRVAPQVREQERPEPLSAGEGLAVGGLAKLLRQLGQLGNPAIYAGGGKEG